MLKTYTFLKYTFQSLHVALTHMWCTYNSNTLLFKQWFHCIQEKWF